MTTLRQLVHGRVDRADRRLLDRRAELRGISLTKCVGDIIREYFALRQEMLSVIKSPDAPGDAHVGLVHSLVARMEGRLAVTLNKRDDELREGQQRIEAMIDWLVQMYLAHTPEARKSVELPPPSVSSDGTGTTGRRWQRAWTRPSPTAPRRSLRSASPSRAFGRYAARSASP